MSPSTRESAPRKSAVPPENRLIQLREFAQRSGWTIATEYVEAASGKNADRKAYKQMFEDASRRKFDVVLTWALDRMTRQGVGETFDQIRTLTSYGVQFVSFTEPHFRTTGPAGELMLAVAAWIAQQEHRRIVERDQSRSLSPRPGARQGTRPSTTRVPSRSCAPACC